MALGLAYWLTIEPAPAVRVQWRPGVSEEQQAALERRYLLVNARDRLDGGSIAYDLLDTSVRNIRALVADEAVADTADIDRDAFTIPFDTEYGGEWMWMAHRLPGLRDERVRRGAIAVLAVMAIGGLWLRFGRVRRNDG
jgi:hypothetical protein